MPKLTGIRFFHLLKIIPQNLTQNYEKTDQQPG